MTDAERRVAWSAEQRDQDGSIPFSREEVAEHPAPEIAIPCGDLGPGDEVRK